MYRVLILVLLNVAVSLGCRPPPCHWHDPEPIENYFKDCARKVIDADRKAQDFCNNQGSNILEVHTYSEYKLVLPGQGNTSYEIKVRDRVVQIVPDSCQNSVTEVRILPTYVDGYGGYYYSDKGDLEVAFPYKYYLLVGGNICEEVKRNVVTLSPAPCVTC